MASVARMMVPDAALLVGRDPCAYADDIAAIERDGCTRDIRFEIDAVLETMRRRASARYAPTRARAMACELVAPIALACETIENADIVMALAMDWIEAMGDVRIFAGRLHAGRAHAREMLAAMLPRPSAESNAEYEQFLRELHEVEQAASTEWPVAFNTRAMFRVESERTLAAILDVHRRDPVVVAIVDIDDGGPPADIRVPEPDLVA